MNRPFERHDRQQYKPVQERGFRFRRVATDADGKPLWMRNERN
ncbi:MAG: hypothetical protein RL268_179 [Pseudomonadota bacterium]|jgi:hypothetical protein